MRRFVIRKRYGENSAPRPAISPPGRRRIPERHINHLHFSLLKILYSTVAKTWRKQHVENHDNVILGREQN